MTARSNDSASVSFAAQDLFQRVESGEYVRVSVREQHVGQRGRGRGRERRWEGGGWPAKHGGTHPHSPTQFHHLAHAHDQQQRWDNMKYDGAEESGVQFELTSGIRISVKLVSISTDIDQTAMKLTGDIHDPQRMIHSNDFGSPLKQPLAQKLYLSNTWYTTMNLEIIQRIFDVIVYIHGPRRINHFMWWPSKLCSEATCRSKCILVQTLWSTTSSLEIKWQLHLKCHCRCSWSPEDASSSVVAGDPLNFAVRQPRKEIPLVILETQNSCRIITAFSERTPAPQRMNIFNFEHPKLAPLWINTNHAIKCVYVAVM